MGTSLNDVTETEARSRGSADQISKEKYAANATRAEFVDDLVEAGFGARVMLASDLARRSDLPAWEDRPVLPTSSLLSSLCSGRAVSMMRSIAFSSKTPFGSWAGLIAITPFAVPGRTWYLRPVRT